MRIHISDVQPGDRLEQDIFNPYGLHVLSGGTVLNDRELSRLYQHRIEYIDILRRPLDESMPTYRPSNVNYEPIRSAYQDALSGCEQLFQQAMANGRIQEDDVEETFQPLMDNFRSERDVVSLLLMLGGQDEYTYQHSVQVGMISFYIARWLGSSQTDTVLAGKAGFLHDIGKCRIPESILNKPGKLTKEEFEEVKKHTQYGFDILSRSLDEEVLAIAALQHHERLNGTGYPDRRDGSAIHPIAKIVSVADVYSAMISTRIYQESKDLLYVLKELYRLSFRELDPDVTHTFIRHMLPNFVGKRVELSDGQSGTIVLMHSTDFFRPLVQCGSRFVDLSTDNTIEITHVQM